MNGTRNDAMSIEFSGICRITRIKEAEKEAIVEKSQDWEYSCFADHIATTIS